MSSDLLLQFLNFHLVLVGSLLGLPSLPSFPLQSMDFRRYSEPALIVPAPCYMLVPIFIPSARLLGLFLGLLESFS